MNTLASLVANVFHDSASMLMALLVFLAAGTLAFAALAVVRVRGAVKKRTARVMDEEDRNSRRSLRYSSRQAVTRLIEYTTKHYSDTNGESTKVLRQRLVQAGIYDRARSPCSSSAARRLRSRSPAPCS